MKQESSQPNAHASAPVGWLTVRDFAQRTGLRVRHVRALVQRGLLFGARKTASGRWRIPAAAVDLYLRGERPRRLDAVQSPEEFLERLWLLHEGKPWRGGRQCRDGTGHD